MFGQNVKNKVNCWPPFMHTNLVQLTKILPAASVEEFTASISIKSPACLRNKMQLGSLTENTN